VNILENIYGRGGSRGRRLGRSPP